RPDAFDCTEHVLPTFGTDTALDRHRVAQTLPTADTVIARAKLRLLHQTLCSRPNPLLSTPLAGAMPFAVAWRLRSAQRSSAQRTASRTGSWGWPWGLCSVPSGKTPTSRSPSPP